MAGTVVASFARASAFLRPLHISDLRSGLTGVSTVTFGGVNATFVLNSDSQLTATVPSNARTGKIRATTIAAKGTSAAVFR